MTREAARYAAVRGADYQSETGSKSPTQAQIAQNVVTPMAVAMDATKLTVQVQVVDGVSGAVAGWDGSARRPTSSTATQVTVANRVRVTVSYPWYPEWLLVGPITLQCVAETPMSY